jgi:hypothetical protein
MVDGRGAGKPFIHMAFDQTPIVPEGWGSKSHDRGECHRQACRSPAASLEPYFATFVAGPWSRLFGLVRII